MLHLAKFSIRRPWPTLAFWAVIAVALGLIGFGISDQLSPTRAFVPGTESQRAQQLAHERFGPSTLVPIMLQGPSRQLDRQGPALATALRKRADTRVLSAWDTGTASQGLRPRPTAGMIVVSVDKPLKEVFKTDQAQIEKTVNSVVTGPVHSHITGQAAIDRAIKDNAIDTTRSAIPIAVGILFILLLIGLRAPVAAAVVAAFGGVTALAGMGLLTLWANTQETEPIAIPLGTMLGLALGVGFALMIVDRFREQEFRPQGHPREAALAASESVATAGRAVLLAATAVIVALTVAGLAGPSENLFATGTGSVICAALGAGAAVVVMPAVLTILGRRIVAFSFAAPRPFARAWDWLVGMGGFVTRRAVLMGAVSTALVAALAIPAFSIGTGPPDVTQLPKSNQARQDYEAISAVMGPGFASPYNIVVASDNLPITSQAMLVNLHRFETQIAADPQVRSVTGPGSLVASTKDLKKVPKGLKGAGVLVNESKKSLGQLENGLGQAGAGAAQLQDGLRQAAGGAGKIQGGGGQLHSGAGLLHGYLEQARAGSAKITAGLSSALSGATQLKVGSAKILAGAGQLTKGLGTAEAPVKAGVPAVNQMSSDLTAGKDSLSAATGAAQATTSQLDSAIAALQKFTTGKSDPGYQSALGAVQQARGSAGSTESSLGTASSKVDGAATVAGALASQLPQLASGLNTLHNGSAQLEGYLAKLRAGNAQLAAGIDKLANGGGQLTSSLGQLRDGAGKLEAGLAQLTGGAGQLSTGLSGGVGPSGQLVAGLAQMQAGVHAGRAKLPSTKDLAKLQQAAPGLFTSGYFVLAAVEGAQPSDRNAATFVVNVTRGGTAGQIMVVPKLPVSEKATRDLGGRLETMTAAFANQTRTEAAVGGPAGELADFTNETNSRIATVSIALAISMALLMMIALRAILLPLAATAFTALATAGSLGVTWLLIKGTDPILGGPGYIDPMSLIETIAGLVAVGMVYVLLLLVNARQTFVKTGDTHAGLRIAMRRTGAVSVGIAAAFVAAVLPYLTNEMMYIRYTISLVAMALIMTFIVRPVLLPAAVEVLGRHAWWPAGREPKAPTEPKARRWPHARPGRLHGATTGGK